MTVIVKTAGSLFDETAEMFVNAVNCQGISGRGIALEFKNRFPSYQTSYKNACYLGFVKPGDGHLWEDNRDDAQPRYIYSFPTKVFPNDKTMMRWISEGMRHLKTIVESCDIQTVAMPAVGCGLGKADWDTVLKFINYYFRDSACVVTVFAPGSETRKEKPAMTEVDEEAENEEEKEYDQVEAAECTTCGDIILKEDVDFDDPCYECGSCGEQFSRDNNDGTHRCPTCNKFASRLSGFWAMPQLQ